MKNRSNIANEEFSFWQSYSDLMSALLLMFVLIMVGLLMYSMNLYESRIADQTAAQEQIQRTREQLEQQRTMLDSQQQQLTEAMDRIDTQQEKLAEQQEQIEKFVGVKEEIIRSLSEEFSKTDLKVDVDASTGSIVFDSSIFFGTDSFEISDNGKAFLDDFIPVYFDALLNSEYASYISEIIIEGHTDTDGTYMYNLELSQKRALAVCKYCIDSIEREGNFEFSRIAKVMTANGRSWSNPVYSSDGVTVDMDASRRVEFKFRLKDDEMIDTMKEIFEYDDTES